MKAVIVSWDMLTPYGTGAPACREGILSGNTKIAPVERFDTGAFHSGLAATVPGLDYRKGPSLVFQMLVRLLKTASVPEDALLFLATTKGEIDLLEKEILEGGTNASCAAPGGLLKKVSKLARLRDGGVLVSAACASSSTALCMAAEAIRAGGADCALVVSCDAVTEFVYCGFSSLMALDPLPARPFDRGRNGLSLGEGAAHALLMSEKRAKEEGREILGEVAGWGLSSDANHMTGPSRDGSGMARAIRRALRCARLSEEKIGLVSAHGTGTPYNDAMEMKAFKAVFKSGRRPVYSIKGAIGHTLGSAGLIEAVMALEFLRSGVSPGTTGLIEPDTDAAGWVSENPAPLKGKKAALIANAGFGGVNAALVLNYNKASVLS